jgi:hypothetical protein
MSNDDFYAQRLAATMAHLSGGRITAEDVAARMAPAPTERLSASEITALIPPLSGSHSITTTMRGRGWGPPEERGAVPTDWQGAAWPRDERGRFAPITIVEEGYDT